MTGLPPRLLRPPFAHPLLLPPPPADTNIRSCERLKLLMEGLHSSLKGEEAPPLPPPSALPHCSPSARGSSDAVAADGFSVTPPHTPTPSPHSSTAEADRHGDDPQLEDLQRRVRAALGSAPPAAAAAASAAAAEGEQQQKQQGQQQQQEELQPVAFVDLHDALTSMIAHGKADLIPPGTQCM